MKKLLLALVAGAASLCGFAATHEITDFSEHDSAQKALRVKTGDTITLPTLEEGSYRAINTRILKIEGNVATVIAPGIVGIQKVDGEGKATATAAVLSVPDPIGNGRVFLWNSGHWDSGNWCSGEKEVWECLAGDDPTEKDYPRLPNDIAILARYNDWAFEINITDDVSIGGLMIGAYTFDKNGPEYRFTIRGPKDSPTIPKLTFSRTDGEDAWIFCCPGGNDANGNSRIKPSFCNITVNEWNPPQPLEIVCASPVVCDLGWDGVTPEGCMAMMAFYSTATLNIPEDSSLTFVNGSPKDDMGGCFNTVECYGPIVGGGRFVNSSRASIQMDFDATDFTGTFVDSSAWRQYNRNGNLWIQNSDKFPHSGLEIDGFVKMQLDVNGRAHYIEQGGAGYFVVGTDHTWPGRRDIGSRLPARELRLRGGAINLMCEKTVWTNLTELAYKTDLLALDNGCNYINIVLPPDDAYPPIAFAATNCVHTYPASAVLNSANLYVRQDLNERGSIYFPWFAEQAVGGIVPWFTAQEASFYKDNVGCLAFPYCDEDGYLVAANITGGNLRDFGDGANVYVENSRSMGISADKTVNSLVVQNPNSNGDRCLGEGRKLTITSGGLVFNSDCSRIGDWKWGTTTDELDPASGTVEFGDTAYVYANNLKEQYPNVIVSKIVASKGFVAAHPGFLAIVGDQTGIDREVVVTAGTLLLGCKINGEGNNSLAQANVNLGCKIDVPVRIVGGGATLKINKANEQTLDPTQNVYFEDIGGFAGKLEIPEGSVETCTKCYVDGVTLPRGTYGATGSGADNIDDDHFAGGGVLKVKKDDLAKSFQIIIL